MIDGKPTKVTPIVSMKKPFTNPQSGPVTEEQKVPEWVYIDNEDVERLAGFGCTNIEIASWFGCDESLIRKSYSEFLTKGREK